MRDFEWDAVNIIGVLITIFNYFIFVPAIIYGLYQFNKLKDDELIIYRHPPAVTLMNIMVIFGLLLERMYILLVSVIDIAAVPAWTVHLIFALTWNAVIYLKLAKIYYIYFCQQYNLAIADRVWTQKINDEQAPSFYIKYKNTYGNMTYLMKIMVIPYIIVAFLSATVASAIDDTPNFYGDVWEVDLFRVIEILFPVLVGFAILYKTRLLNDIYQIRNEVIISMITLGCSFILYVSIFSVRWVSNLNKKADLSRVSSLINIFIMEGVAFSGSILATMYPVYLVKQKQKKSEIEKHMKNNHTDSTLQTIDKVMSEYESFKAFMSYLVTEFSPENMLFLVELIQIKIEYQKKQNHLIKILAEANGTEKYITVNFNKNPNDLVKGFDSENQRHFTYIFHASGSIMTKLSIPMELPTSKILEKHSDSLYYQMAALYEKYVKNESRFALNISYKVRDMLTKVFDEDYAADFIDGKKKLIPTPMDQRYSNEQLYNIMDEVVIEIIQLLQCSFLRFTDCDAFYQLDMDLSKTKNNYAVFVDDEGDVNPVSRSAHPTDGIFKDYLNDAATGIVKIQTDI